MSEFIGRFTLPEDKTTGKSYYGPIKKQAVNMFKGAIRRKNVLFPKMRVNHLLMFYLRLITKALIYVKSCNGQ